MHFEQRVRILLFARTSNVSTTLSSKNNAYPQRGFCTHSHANRSGFFCATCILLVHVRIDNFKIVLVGFMHGAFSKSILWSTNENAHQHALHRIASNFGSSAGLILTLQTPSSASTFAALTGLHIAKCKASLWDRFIHFVFICRRWLAIRFHRWSALNLLQRWKTQLLLPMHTENFFSSFLFFLFSKESVCTHTTDLPNSAIQWATRLCLKYEKGGKNQDCASNSGGCSGEE